MKTTAETLTDVPAGDLELTAAEFVTAGASVMAIRQADGQWTIVATFTVAA